MKKEGGVFYFDHQTTDILACQLSHLQMLRPHDKYHSLFFIFECMKCDDTKKERKGNFSTKGYNLQ